MKRSSSTSVPEAPSTPDNSDHLFLSDEDLADLPKDARMIRIPISSSRDLIALYLVRNPSIDETLKLLGQVGSECGAGDH